ncbi:hypothetical protein M2347_001156 [Chryseobacterium sp. H1D6B]|uniref:hypothetical protein n=1 Tax=Chryseobacterium sp. H1D6B TaxID=2940588 RepID=UPI0015CBE8ED|nr:hypothetical protein [Chryseobacterium sp. H1D6B]MDH6251429.1 hypothetical protein [Chryseobacterium sp. H1D6B]
MKKAFILNLFILGFSSVTAQVGISTSAPQKALHVAGAVSSAPIDGIPVNIVRPTIRIDGLSNSSQSTTDKLRPVSATDKGDLVLSHLSFVPLVIIDPINTANSEDDYIPNPIVINQSAGNTITNTVIRSFTFTLNSASLVKFSTTTSFRFQKASDGNVITDGSNRTWGTKYRFSSAPAGIPTTSNAYFGETIHGYSNAVNNAGATGTFYASSDETLLLPKGSYILDVNLFAGTESSQPPMRITCGGGIDTISIVAYPIQ